MWKGVWASTLAGTFTAGGGSGRICQHLLCWAFKQSEREIDIDKGLQSQALKADIVAFPPIRRGLPSSSLAAESFSYREIKGWILTSPSFSCRSDTGMWVSAGWGMLLGTWGRIFTDERDAKINGHLFALDIVIERHAIWSSCSHKNHRETALDLWHLGACAPTPGSPTSVLFEKLISSSEIPWRGGCVSGSHRHPNWTTLCQTLATWPLGMFIIILPGTHCPPFERWENRGSERWEDLSRTPNLWSTKARVWVCEPVPGGSVHH